MSPVATEIETAGDGACPTTRGTSIYTGNYTTSADANHFSAQRAPIPGHGAVETYIRVDGFYALEVAICRWNDRENFVMRRMDRCYSANTWAKAPERRAITWQWRAYRGLLSTHPMGSERTTPRCADA